MIKVLSAIFAAAYITGACSSMTGLDAESGFQCKAPAGVSCQSVSGVYANAAVDNLPFQDKKQGNRRSSGDLGDRTETGHESEAWYFDRNNKVSPKNMDALSSGVPIRKAPFVLRVWVAPYEDDLADLHDQSYFYTVVDSGKWMIEANRTAISNQFKPVYPLHVKSSQPRGKTTQYTDGGQPQGQSLPVGVTPMAPQNQNAPASEME